MTARDENEDCMEQVSSKLGTKEHWDNVYHRELNVFRETKDPGEVWFGMDSVERIIDWMDNSELVNENDSILDLGCGNGVLLIELSKRGFTNLTGVDYSVAAIQLAKSVAEEENFDIKYEVCDILADLPTKEDKICQASQYDICLDKGTYDAISLNPESPKLQRQKYKTKVNSLVKDGGFSLLETIPTPTFQFGGQTGSRETVIVFRRKG